MSRPAKYDPTWYPPNQVKRCPRCGEERALTPENFGPAGRRKGVVYFSWCRFCNRERSAAAVSTPEGVEKHRGYRRRHMLRARYDIDPNDYEMILSWQGGVCKICKEAPGPKKPGGPVTPLQVDHDHGTGAVRGLLCFRCNAGIGNLRDSPDLMRAAAAYVEGAR